MVFDIESVAASKSVLKTTVNDDGFDQDGNPEPPSPSAPTLPNDDYGIAPAIMRPDSDSSHGSTAVDPENDLPLEGKPQPEMHGDLPNPDEIPRHAYHRRRVAERKRMAFLIAACLMVLSALVVVLVTYFGPGSSAAKSAATGVTSSDTPSGPRPSYPNYPKPSPPGPPTNNNLPDDDKDATGSGTDAARLKSIREYLIGDGISTPGSLQVSGTPQRLAMEWMAAADPLRVALPTAALKTEYSIEARFVQRYTLAVLFFSLGGKLGHTGTPGSAGDEKIQEWKTNLSWMTGEGECKWNDKYRTDDNNGENVHLGAVCDSPGTGGQGDGWEWGRVTKIWIPWDHGLSGSLPPEIRHLTHLTSISMAYQTIGGTIPTEVCSLQRLEEFSLSNNYLINTLPACLSKMDSLRILALDDNLLTGDLSVVEQMKDLEFLYLEDNGIEHTLDDNSLKDMEKLIHLDLSDNKLAGNIPAHLLAHPTLKVLDLHDNGLTGPLPHVYESQSTLEFLALHRNDLTDGIGQAKLGNLKGLLYLDLAHNRFTGKLAEWGALGIGGLTQLKYLFVGGNDYEDQTFPQFLANMTGLLELSLKDSNIGGPIPNWIGQLKELYLLDLDGNGLSGKVPSQMGELTNLLFLLLNRNLLTGQLPPEMANLVNLHVLLLDDNSLTGGLDEYVCPVLHNDTEVSADCAIPSSSSNTSPSPGSDGSTAAGAVGNGTTVTATSAAATSATAATTATTTVPARRAQSTEPEISCNSACCTICCMDGGEPCNDDKWIANNDPIWEHRYGRYRFVFENDDGSN